MTKNIIIIAFLCLGVVSYSYANDSGRIDQLEKKVKELNTRILELESLLGGQNTSSIIATLNKNWKSVSNWRKLTTDMNYTDIQELLGEPERVNGGEIAIWFYQNGGQVTFMDGKVYDWTEPRM